MLRKTKAPSTTLAVQVQHDRENWGYAFTIVAVQDATNRKAGINPN